MGIFLALAYHKKKSKLFHLQNQKLITIESWKKIHLGALWNIIISRCCKPEYKLYVRTQNEVDNLRNLSMEQQKFQRWRLENLTQEDFLQKLSNMTAYLHSYSRYHLLLYSNFDAFNNFITINWLIVHSI